MTVDKDQVYVALESFVTGDGIHYEKDATRISGALVKKNKWEHLFKPLEVHHDVESATKAPGEKRGASEPVEQATAAPGEKRGMTTQSVKGK